MSGPKIYAVSEKYLRNSRSECRRRDGMDDKILCLVELSEYNALKEGKKSDKLRPLGDITQDLEPLLFEMCEKHDLQHGEILNLIKGWLDIHYPKGREEYVDGSGSPVVQIVEYRPLTKTPKEKKR